MSEQTLTWLFPGAGLTLLVLIAGVRIHLRNSRLLSLGDIVHEPHANGGATWSLRVRVEGSEAITNISATVERLERLDGGGPAQFLVAPLYWPNQTDPCHPTLTGGGTPHRVDLLRNDVATQPITRPMVTNIAYCGLTPADRTRALPDGNYRILVRFAGDRAGAQLVWFDIDLDAITTNPERVITREVL